jgi:pyruvate/2-oxoglutarate dehydrogenase complex dihydrolipoamide dehydrogenase (E3) component
VKYLTNESVFSLTELPRRFGVIGAGPIGCELAQSFAQLGSEVFLVESEYGILPREDREAAEIAQKAMLRDGVKLLCCGRQLEIKNEGGIWLMQTTNGTLEPPVELRLGLGVVSRFRLSCCDDLDFAAC